MPARDAAGGGCASEAPEPVAAAGCAGAEEAAARAEAAPLALVATLRGHAGVVWCVAWSARGVLASGGADKTVRVWSAGEGGAWACVATVPPGAFLRSVRGVAWGVDGRSVACASFDGAATVLELVGGRAPRLEAAVSLEGHESEVKGVAYSAGGGLLATCSRDRSVWVWEVGVDWDYECAAVLSGHSGDVKAVAWHPGAELLVSAGYDGEVRVWAEDEDDWFCAETLAAHGGTVWGVAFGPGGRLASVGADGALVLWERAHAHASVVGSEPPRFRVVAHVVGAHRGPVLAVDWAEGEGGAEEGGEGGAEGGGEGGAEGRGGGLVVTGGDDDAIRVWRREEGRAGEGAEEEKGENNSGSAKETWTVQASACRAHVGGVNCVRWGPGARLVASAGDDGLVRLWALEH